MSDFDPVMDGLRDRVDELRELLPAGAPLAYLDYPLHRNIGDLLIMLGTERFFERHRLDVRYRASVVSYDRRRIERLPDDTVIVLHGGGNLGDLHPRHQRFRERVIGEFPERRIVVLPQTVHFRDPANLAIAARVFGAHPDLHLVTRDAPSRERAEAAFACRIYLAPDMAHQLWPEFGAGIPRRPQREVGFHLRTDIEISALSAALAERRADAFDWSDLFTPLDRARYRIIRSLHAVERRSGLPTGADRLWRSTVAGWAERAARRYASHRSMVTSRLHGHILACLLRIPHRLLDNSYGKNSGYHRTWTSEIDEVDLVLDERDLAAPASGGT